MYLTDAYGSTIRRINIATGAVATLAGSLGQGYADGTGSAARFGPLGYLTVNAAGTILYVANRLNFAIRKIT